ncbi:MAG: Rne/Rng family ribonuclease [Syntrophobacterales bacterium]|jgi:ribonuclease G
MSSQLIMSVSPWDVRAALVENGRLAELHVERSHGQEPTGNIYQGRVRRVLPGMSAAFVDLGLDKPGYLFAQEAASALHEIPESWLRGEQEEDLPLKPSLRLPSPPIEDLLAEGQELLVQVSRPPLGSKGARLTTQISLPGRYLVYLPTVSHLAVSRRLAPESERQRLHTLLEDLQPEEGGLIARTASAGQSWETLAAERDTLVARWKQIRQRQHTASAPSLLHQELPVIRRLVRDLVSLDVIRLVVDDAEAYEKMLAYLKLEGANQAPLVELYTGQEPIFSAFHLEERWQRLLAPQVWLKSGGYLIIDTTEALTAIDVNTGRFTQGRDLEDTILTTNLEAAREAARQIRLRNLSGILVVDFIDMENPAQRDLVHQTLQKSFQKDRARTTVYPMSPLGLVEMTRQRLRDSLAQVVTVACPCCRGQGAVMSPLVVAHDILRQLAWEAREFAHCRLIVTAPPEVIALVKQEGEDFFRELHASRQIFIHLSEDSHLPRDRFDIIRELHKGGEKV